MTEYIPSGIIKDEFKISKLMCGSRQERLAGISIYLVTNFRSRPQSNIRPGLSAHEKTARTMLRPQGRLLTQRLFKCDILTAVSNDTNRTKIYMNFICVANFQIQFLFN